MRKIRYKEPSQSLEKMVAPNFDESSRSSVGMDKFVGEYFFIEVSKLIPFKKQARLIFNDEELESLANTIKEHGIRQPLTVIKSQDQEEKFEVVSGERRLRASKIAGLEKVPCIVITDRNSAEEIALIENIQRQNLHPIELADAIAALLRDKEHGSQVDFAIRIGVSKQQISHLIAISRLPEDIKLQLLKKEDLKIGSLKSIAYLKDENAIREKVSSFSSKNKFSSVLRFSFNGKSFKLDHSKIDSLNQEEKQLLKSELEKVLDVLNN